MLNRPWWTVGMQSAWILALGLCGCDTGPDPDISAVKKRAAFELNCPRSELKAFFIDDTTIGVKGCGTRLVYVQVCGGSGPLADCKWVLNSEGRRRSED